MRGNRLRHRFEILVYLANIRRACSVKEAYELLRAGEVEWKFGIKTVRRDLELWREMGLVQRLTQIEGFDGENLARYKYIGPLNLVHRVGQLFCGACKEFLPIDKFRPSNLGGKYICGECRRKVEAGYFYRNREHVLRRKKKEYYRKKERKDKDKGNGDSKDNKKEN